MALDNITDNGDNPPCSYLTDSSTKQKLPFNPLTREVILPNDNAMKLPDYDTMHEHQPLTIKTMYCPVANQTIKLEIGGDYSTCTHMKDGGKMMNDNPVDFGAKSKEDITGCNCKEFDEKVNRLLQQIQEARK